MPFAERYWQFGAASLFCLVTVTGCGGGLPAPVATAVSSASTIGGNWLLYGSFPKAVGNSSNLPGMAISFDAIGNNLVASASISTYCSGSGTTFGARFGSAITGTVASDGSFTAATPQVGGITLGAALTVSGKVPATAGAAWSGTYTLTSNSTFCSVTQTGPFTATAVQDISGTYMGSGTLLVSSGTGNLGNAPVTVSLALQQGAPLYSPIGSTPVSSRLGVKGSIQILGISCFSKGTISTSAPSQVEGGPLLLNFAMEDGSTALVLGSIDDVAASRLDINFIEVSGGLCGGLYSFGINPLVVLR